MTVSDIETAARRKYNSVSNNFYSSAEIYDLIYQAELELSRDALQIEAVDTSISTVASTRAYAYPSEVIAIKRIEWDGNKLQPIDFREDDIVNLVNASITPVGNPQYYTLWKSFIYLRPVPDSIKTLTIYAIKQPVRVISTTTLEIPTLWHMDIVDFVCQEMAAKDLNLEIAAYYSQRWQTAKIRAKQWQQKRIRRDGFSNVKSEDGLITTQLGAI